MKGFSPVVYPETLLSAMWYQFSEELSGHRKYKYCSHCNTWQDVTNNHSNWSGHPECVNAARVSSWRKGKASAKKLYVEGCTIEEIAHKLEKPEKIIQKWFQQWVNIPRKERG